MNRQGVKYSSQDKYTKSSIETRASYHNERVDELSQKIQKKIEDGNFSDIEISSLKKLKESLENSKISLNPESKLDQSKLLDDAISKIDKSKSIFERSDKKVGSKFLDIKKELQKLKDSFNKDKSKSEQEVKLNRQKDRLKSKNSELERKINAGEFEDKPIVELNKSDKELVNLQIEKNKLESIFNSERDKLESNNKKLGKKIIETTRAAYVATLIYKFGTFAKVAYAAVFRPTIEAGTKVTGGKLFSSIFGDISKAAKRGGESNSIQSIARSYEAQLAQYGEKKFKEKSEKNIKEFQDANKNYYDYLSEHNEIVKNNPKYSKVVEKSEKKLKYLKNKSNLKLLNTYIDMAYSFIGTSSIKDAMDALIYRSNKIERMFGYLEKEGIEQGDYVDKFNYLLGFIGRSHGAMKTFSARASFMASMTARLEAAIEDGVNINDKFMELADESYLDWERGKYQQSNFITDQMNKIALSLENSYKGTSWEKYAKGAAAFLKLDLPITRVPVNILHEAVSEYTLGAIKASVMAAKEYSKAKKDIRLMEDANNLLSNKDFKKELSERIQQMDAKTAATIARSFRKGAVGLGLYALVGSMVLVKFGGFYNKGDKKKKEEDLGKDELNLGDIMLGDSKLSETASKVLEHLPAMYPTLLGLNAAKRYNDKILSGKMDFDAAYSAFMSDVESMQDAIPQTKIINPIGIIKKIGTSTTKTIDSFWESRDTDSEGNPIKRKAMDFKDEINLMIGDRSHIFILFDIDAL